MNESVQKAGIPGIPGCIEHAFAIWESIQHAKKQKEDVAMVWLDLANAYGSVPHQMIHNAMDFFWIPEEVQRMLMAYYNNFKMRFTTSDYTTDWQSLEVGIAAGCTVSVILFVLVMEMMLKSTDCQNTLVRTPLRAFMDDITVKSKDENGMKEVLKQLEKLVEWSKMRFKAKKSRSVTYVKGKQKEIKYMVSGEMIPIVKEQPVKSLGRWYKDTLSDRSQGVEIQNLTEEGLKSIDKTELPGKYKCWCLQFGLYPRVLWPLQVYEVPLTRVERIEQRCGIYIRKWLGLPRMLNNSAIFGKQGQLKLPIASIVEEYKVSKVRTVMMLRFSNDPEIKDNPPEVRIGRKWRPEEATDNVICILNHADIVGASQDTRQGVGMQNFRPFCTSSQRQRRDAVVREIRKEEQEKRYLHLVNCSQQGQCVRWEEFVVDRKVGWKEIWSWERARTSFLIKSTYNAMPSPVNLVRWKIESDDKCRCGKRGTLKHILSNCNLSLNRYTWRHNQVLKVITNLLEIKIKKINEGELPKIERIKKMTFHKAGTTSLKKSHTKAYVTDDRWNGKWKVAADLQDSLVFPLVITAQRPDLVVWCEEMRKAIIMELTVPWEDNFEKAEERKEKRYDELLTECQEQGWKIEYFHLAVGARGYVDRKLINFLRHRFCCTNTELRKLTSEVQEAAEKASYWIWLKRDDLTWIENSS